MRAKAVPSRIVPSPPAALDCNVHGLAPDTVLHRIHDQRFGATAFNPGFGSSRFAPLDSGGTQVPTAYAATSLECAMYESIFHEIEPGAAFKSIRWSALVPIKYSQVKLNRELRLAQLFSADLMKWGLERSQLIDTPKSTYPDTRAWSAAIHASDPKLDGMVWTSRKFDQEKALVLFGDRVGAGDLTEVSSVRITSDAAVLRVVHALARRSDILIAR